MGFRWASFELERKNVDDEIALWPLKVFKYSHLSLYLNHIFRPKIHLNGTWNFAVSNWDIYFYTKSIVVHRVSIVYKYNIVSAKKWVSCIKSKKKNWTSSKITKHILLPHKTNILVFMLRSLVRVLKYKTNFFVWGVV